MVVNLHCLSVRSYVKTTICVRSTLQNKKRAWSSKKKRGRGRPKKIVDDNGENLPIGTRNKAGGGAGRGAKAKPALVLQ